MGTAADIKFSAVVVIFGNFPLNHFVNAASTLHRFDKETRGALPDVAVRVCRTTQTAIPAACPEAQAHWKL